MRVINVPRTLAEIKFAERAAVHFNEHVTSNTYTDGEVESGRLFAVRWNSFTVLVFMLDECHTPTCYPIEHLIPGLSNFQRVPTAEPAGGVPA